MQRDLKSVLKSVQLPGVEWVGLRHVKEIMKQRSIREGKPESNSIDYDEGVMFEVLHRGQFGYAGTCDLSLHGLQRAATAAFKMAEVSAEYRIHSFTEKQREKVVGNYETKFEKPFAQIDAGAINDLLIEACQHLKGSKKIATASTDAVYWDIETKMVSTNGSEIEQHILQAGINLSAIAQEGSLTQKRSTGYLSHCHQKGAEYFHRQNILNQADELCREAVELLTAEECPTGNYDLVLAPDQMLLQIHESIGHPLELDRIMGDERNYAGWSFVKLSDFGHLQYGSPLLNVTFDPTVAIEMASYGFDDSGTRATREYIIKDGVLQRGLGGIDSQLRSGKLGVSNSRATSWNRAPIDRMANLNLEPGNSSFAELIASTERGVFMKSNNSWSIDDYRRKFQFGCEYGKLIENGELTKTVRNPNYRGIGIEFWRNLVGVGNAESVQVFGTPNCGKGEPNQVIRVGHSSPACKFQNIEVFGGGK